MNIDRKRRKKGRPVSNEITPRQQQILERIREYWVEVGTAPTINGMAEDFDMYPNGMQSHVNALRRKGAIDESVLSPIGLHDHIKEFFK